MYPIWQVTAASLDRTVLHYILLCNLHQTQTCVYQFRAPVFPKFTKNCPKL